MRNIVSVTLLIVLGIFFTGCSTTTFQFNQKHVDFKISKNIKQVKEFRISIADKEEYNIKKRPLGLVGKAHSKVLTGNFNEEILYSMLTQYFNEVRVSNNKNVDLFIDSKILDFEFSNLMTGGIELQLKIDINVYKNKKMILNKIYNSTITEDGKFFSIRLDSSELQAQFFSVALYRFYDEKFKPDLLKALKENI